jgi:hypothetical protein
MSTAGEAKSRKGRRGAITTRPTLGRSLTSRRNEAAA